CQHGSGILTF
nr:immunoglobulin light chain junction region [Macaca mulatta]